MHHEKDTRTSLRHNGDRQDQLCNNLTRGARAVGNGPKGVTSKTHIYPAFTVGDDQIEIVDTAGLNEAVEGTVPPEEAIKQILLLLQSAAEGFSLLIHVMRMGRLRKTTRPITSSSSKNWASVMSQQFWPLPVAKTSNRCPGGSIQIATHLRATHTKTSLPHVVQKEGRWSCISRHCGNSPATK